MAFKKAVFSHVSHQGRSNSAASMSDCVTLLPETEEVDEKEVKGSPKRALSATSPSLGRTSWTENKPWPVKEFNVGDRYPESKDGDVSGDEV